MLKTCEFILSNLREEDEKEIIAVWGSNWKQRLLFSLSKTKVLFAFGKNSKGENVPIAMGGFYEPFIENPEIACVWLLSTKDVYLNKISIMKEIRKQILIAEKKYSLMYNYIYKSNKLAKKWLKKLGFCFNNPKPKELTVRKGFEFFYKVTNGKDLQCAFMKLQK